MVLVLNNGERIPVTRLNCSYQTSSYGVIDGYYESRNWNVYPPKILSHEETGFFVIARYGTTEKDFFEKMIPLRSVVYIEDDGTPWNPGPLNVGEIKN